MLPADHPLAELQAQAAVASGWATLHLLRPDEGALDAARATLEAAFGPVPQADVIEPHLPGEEPWELRIDLPGLDLFDVDTIRAALPDAVFVPGVRPGRRTAEDVGVTAFEELEADGVIARMAFDAEEGGVLPPDLARGSGEDAALRELEVELAEAIRRVAPELGFRSDRGADTVQPVVHRATGRFGVQLVIDAPWEELPGDRVTALRQELLAALATVVRARADHPKVRFAPDVAFDLRLGLSFVLWFVAHAVAGLPGDQATPRGVSPEGVTARIAGLDGLADEIEIQVVPRAPADHDRVVQAVQALAEAGLPLLGGMPRWVRYRGAEAFAPAWRVLAEDEPHAAIAALSAVEGAGAVRIVPGAPAGYADDWAFADPVWHAGAARWFVRVRDGRRDRDALPKVVQRAHATRDQEVRDALGAVSSQHPAAADGLRGLGWRAVVDSAGREGLEIALGAAALRDGPLRAALDALGDVRVEGLCSLATWGWRGDGLVVQLWWAREQPGEAAIWG